MTNKRTQKFYKHSDKEKDFSKNIHKWLAQYDENEDFLSGKVPISLPDFKEEE
jgi:hypothetical protein